MREIKAEQLTEVIKKLCIEACYVLPQDVRNCIECSMEKEPWEPAKEILSKIVENYHIAEDNRCPICQDTGVACVFLEIGQDVHIEGSIEDAVNAGVAAGYTEGYLRKSVVSDPIERKNTGDNTPAMIYEKIVPGDKITVTVDKDFDLTAIFGIGDGIKDIMIDKSIIEGVYDLMGRKLKAPQKGINIINGKKTLVK